MHLQHRFHSSGNLSAVNSYRGCSLLAKCLLLLLCCAILLMENPLYLCAVLHSQQVRTGNRQNTVYKTIQKLIRTQLSCESIHVHTHTSIYCIPAYTCAH